VEEGDPMRAATVGDSQGDPSSQGHPLPSGCHIAPVAGPVRVRAIGTPDPVLGHALDLAGAVLAATPVSAEDLDRLVPDGLPDIFVYCAGAGGAAETAASGGAAGVAACGSGTAGMAASGGAAEVVALVTAAARYRPTVVVGPSRWRLACVALAAGAVAYLATDAPGVGPRLPSLIIALADRDRGVRPEGHRVRPGPPAGLDKLSQRERETLGYIAAGYTHRQTARRMGVSKATVDTFVERVRTKLGVGNKAELTRVAMAAGDAAGSPDPVGGGAAREAPRGPARRQVPAQPMVQTVPLRVAAVGSRLGPL
jgi:DNA-binding CsgD family transcriptional regulator